MYKFSMQSEVRNLTNHKWIDIVEKWCVIQVKIGFGRTGKLAFYNFEVRVKLILEFKQFDIP